MRKLRRLSLLFAAVYLAAAVTSSAGTLIDVAFTSASVTGKTGFAATGVTTNDFWNTCRPGVHGQFDPNAVISNLRFVDGTASGAGLTVANVNGVYANGSSDPMYGVYLDSDAANITLNITVKVTNLIQGVYDFYLYGHGNEDNQNGVFQLMAGSQSYGSEATTNGSGWLSSVWQEGVQYVEFKGVVVLAGQTNIITVEPGGSQYAVISGLQMLPLVLPADGSPLFISNSN